MSIPTRSSMRNAAAGLLCAITACSAAGGPASAKDLWQTYMEAALDANKTGDFKTEAVVLDVALAFAREHDPDGQRPALARLPLMLAYGELDRRDLIKPLAAQGMRIDVGNLDPRYDDYIESIDAYASSYYDRWIAHKDDNPSDDKQGFRSYGMKNSYLIEVALRTKLRSADKIGLATAMSQAGLAYRKQGDLECAAYELDRAFEMFSELRDLGDALAEADRRFSANRSVERIAEESTVGSSDMQAYLTLVLGMDMTDLAYDSLHPQSAPSSAGESDLSRCDAFGGPRAKGPPVVGFDAQVRRALQSYDAVLKLTSELRQRWPGHPFFGALDFRLAQLFKLEYEWSKAHPGTYPGAVEKARRAYEQSLDNLTTSQGLSSDFVRPIAADYLDLLLEAGLNAEAKRIEDRYGVAPRTTNN